MKTNMTKMKMTMTMTIMMMLTQMREIIPYTVQYSSCLIGRGIADQSVAYAAASVVEDELLDGFAVAVDDAVVKTASLTDYNQGKYIQKQFPNFMFSIASFTA